MAIKPETEFVGKINASDADYPQGSARDITAPSDGLGTPWKARLINDIWGFVQKLLAVAGITPSGSPDTVLLSDYFDGLMTVVTRPTLTVSTMTATAGVRAGNVFNAAERSTGNAGGGFWTAIATGTTPGVDLPNTFNIVIGVADPLISFVLKIEGVIKLKQLGLGNGGDDTAGFLVAIATGKKIWGFNEDTYRINSRLTFDQDDQQLIGGFKLLYIGPNTDRLFDLAAKRFTAKNIRFDGNVGQVRFALGYIAKDSEDASFIGCHFQNMRGTAKGATVLNQQYGLCIDYDTVENLNIHRCTFRNLVSVNSTAGGGAVEGLGFIGGIVLLSENGSDPVVPQTFPSYGKITKCTFDKIITELDVGLNQADRNTFDDGDGIRFLGVVGVSDRANFEIEGNLFNQCSKRAMKSAIEGVIMKNNTVIADSNVYPMTTVVKMHGSNTCDGLDIKCDLVADQPDLLVQVGWIQTVDNDEGIHVKNITSPFADIVFDLITTNAADAVTNVFLDGINCQSVTTRVFSQSGVTPTSSIIKADNVDVIGVGATTKGLVVPLGEWRFGRVRAKNMDWKGVGGSIDDLELTIDSGAFTGTGSDSLVELNGTDVNHLKVDASGLLDSFLDGARGRIVLLQGSNVAYKHLDVIISETMTVTSQPHIDIMGDDVTVGRLEYSGEGLVDIGTLIASDGVEVGTCVRKGTGVVSSPFIISNNASSDNIVIGQCTDFRASSAASVRLVAGNKMVVANAMSRSTLAVTQDDTAANMTVVNATAF